MKVAIYARVSTEGQTLDQQFVACRRLCEARGWEVTAEIGEVATTRKTRPKKEALLLQLRQGYYGALVLFRLDRWARSLAELVQEVEDLSHRGVHVVSVTETIDTSSAMGRATLQLMGVFSQLERDLHSERTRDRLAALKAMGKKLGRPPVLTADKIGMACHLREQGYSYRRIGKLVGASESTIRRVLRHKPPLADPDPQPTESADTTPTPFSTQEAP